MTCKSLKNSCPKKSKNILEILVSKPLYSLLIKQIHLLYWNTELTTIPVILVILTPARYDFKKFQRIFLTPEWNFSPTPFVYSPGALYHWATTWNSWELRPYFKSGISKSAFLWLPSRTIPYMLQELFLRLYSVTDDRRWCILKQLKGLYRSILQLSHGQSRKSAGDN